MALSATFGGFNEAAIRKSRKVRRGPNGPKWPTCFNEAAIRKSRKANGGAGSSFE